MQIQWLAVFAAALGGFVTGGLWYALFGKAWMSALGWDDETAKAQNRRTVLFVVAVGANIIMALMLYGLLMHMGGNGLRAALIASVLIWFGFVLPTTVANYACQNRPVKLILIDAFHWLAVLLVQGLTLGLMMA